MLLYAVILFVAALLFLGLGIAIYKGKTELIHDYHQQKVTDKAAYGKAFGKGMFLLAAAMALSGGIGAVAPVAGVAALLVELVIGIGYLLRVQKKFNDGLF